MAKRKAETCAAPTLDREWQAHNDLDTLRRADEIVPTWAAYAESSTAYA